MKIPVNQHSSVTIIQRGDTPEFMFQEYDDTYPRVSFRKKAHIIGGNYQPSDSVKGIVGDSSPYALLQREISEEFSLEEHDPSEGIEKHLLSIMGEGPGAQRVGEFAPARDIARLRSEVLSTARPLKDFLYHVPPMDGKNPFSGVVSVYHSFVHPELFEVARDHISQGKAVRNEGGTRLATGEEVIKGIVPSAWWTQDVIADFLGVTVQNPYGIKIEEVGIPKDRWDTYLDRFDYNVAIK